MGESGRPDGEATYNFWMTTTPPASGPRRKPDVLIRGDGVVGQTLALLLARHNIRTALCGTRLPKPTGERDIRAYAINGESRSILESVRAWPEASTDDVVTPVVAIEVHGDRDGLLRFNAADQGLDALSWIVDVPALEDRLALAVEFQGAIERTDTAPADVPLTVVCEGKRSQTRAELGLDTEVKPYPHRALATRLQLDAPHHGVARQWFHAQGILALLPLGGRNGSQAALVWSAPAAAVQELQSLEDGVFMERLQAICHAGPAPIGLTHARQSWPLEWSLAPRWTLPGVALAGDAAHAMHPLAGQGLNVGLGDAAELARVLQHKEYWRELGDPRLLRRYERARKAAFARMGHLTDGLFQLFQLEWPTVSRLRNWGLSGVNRWPGAKRWLTRQAMG